MLRLKLARMSVTLPSLPARIISRAVSCILELIPWLPIWRTRPAVFAAAIISGPSSIARVMGFSR